MLKKDSGIWAIIQMRWPYYFRAADDDVGLRQVLQGLERVLELRRGAQAAQHGLVGGAHDEREEKPHREHEALPRARARARARGLRTRTVH